ncbi:hypothetical protein [Herbaspirillum autotrophicum]|uniref:hypothetical protein n=1 Tax=Herbaspirillum autotrophicum TaxID=180195 RepID=UPI00067B2FB5|nr:hypothetical protein [Herbaspirillum autotrophicum]
MKSNKSLLLAVGIASAAVCVVLNIFASRAERQEKKLQRKALHRWEGEGGTVLTPQMPAAEDHPNT